MGGPRTRPDVRREIERLAGYGWSPPQIRRALDQDERYRGEVPTNKTIYRYTRKVWGPSNPAESWRLADLSPDAPPATVRGVLRVLAELTYRSEGRRRHLSVAEADWAARISSAAPELPPWVVFRLARECLTRAKKGAAMDDVTELLALAPWRDDAAQRRYAAARDAGWLIGGELARDFVVWASQATATSVEEAQVKDMAEWAVGAKRTKSESRAQLERQVQEWGMGDAGESLDDLRLLLSEDETEAQDGGEASEPG